MLNRIILMGRLTRDPELRRTGSGTAVTSFSLAVDRDFKSQSGEKETDFIDIVAWRNTAEFVSKYFTKGRMAVVEGPPADPGLDRQGRRQAPQCRGRGRQCVFRGFQARRRRQLRLQPRLCSRPRFPQRRSQQFQRQRL